MSTEVAVTCDGVALAKCVRAIASRAQRTLKQPTNLAESRELLEAIGSLERATKSRTSSEISRWLSSLRKRIESHKGSAF